MSLPLDKAEALATRIKGELLPFCDRIEIAGSIRRRRPNVNDIDLVCLPKAGQFHALRSRIRMSTQPVMDGSENIIVRLKNGFQLDVFIAQREQRDLISTKPTNFGTLLLARTGSKEHNIFIASRAKSMGLSWNPYYGVFNNGKCIACETEEEIFQVLDLDYINPDKRER